jgi:hypothetical protein
MRLDIEAAGSLADPEFEAARVPPAPERGA